MPYNIYSPVMLQHRCVKPAEGFLIPASRHLHDPFQVLCQLSAFLILSHAASDSVALAVQI